PRRSAPGPQARRADRADRGAGGLTPPAMGERHEQEPGIAEEGEDRSAGERQDEPPAPPDPAEIGEAVAGDERQAGKPGPDETMQHDVGRRKARRDAVARRREPAGPEQRGGGPAGDAEEGCRPLRHWGRGSHGMSLALSIPARGAEHGEAAVISSLPRAACALP